MLEEHKDEPLGVWLLFQGPQRSSPSPGHKAPITPGGLNLQALPGSCKPPGQPAYKSPALQAEPHGNERLGYGLQAA